MMTKERFAVVSKVIATSIYRMKNLRQGVPFGADNDPRGKSVEELRTIPFFIQNPDGSREPLSVDEFVVVWKAIYDEIDSQKAILGAHPNTVRMQKSNEVSLEPSDDAILVTVARRFSNPLGS